MSVVRDIWKLWPELGTFRRQLFEYIDTTHPQPDAIEHANPEGSFEWKRLVYDMLLDDGYEEAVFALYIDHERVEMYLRRFVNEGEDRVGVTILDENGDFIFEEILVDGALVRALAAFGQEEPVVYALAHPSGEMSRAVLGHLAAFLRRRGYEVF